MTTKFTEVINKRRKKYQKYFDNYKEWARKIKNIAKKELQENIEVKVFGSILKNNEVPRDIDLLIITEQAERIERGQLKAKIDKQIGISNPFEIHIVTSEKYNNWYKHFIKKSEVVN